MLLSTIKKYQRAGLIVSLPVVLFVFDRMLKNLFGFSERYWPVWGDWVYLAFVANPGIAFGIALADWLIISLTAVIMIYLIHLLIRSWQMQNWWEILAIILILAGAASNLLDRIFYGVVIDYIVVSQLTVLNLADVMITMGVVGLVGVHLFPPNVIPAPSVIGRK